MPQQTSHRTFLLYAILFGFNIITFVHGQVNSDLDRPFITKDGESYRDKLTIATSKSVANFAKSYQRRQNGQVIENSTFVIDYDIVIMCVYMYSIFSYISNNNKKGKT